MKNKFRHIKGMMELFTDKISSQEDSVPKTLYRTGKLVSFKLLDTAVSAYAGQAAFMLILSFFPFIMFMLALFRYMPFSPELLISAVETFFPVSFRSFMDGIIKEIYQIQASTVLPATVISALWLGSRSFLSIIYGLNSVYEIPETRGYLMLRLQAVLYTLLFAFMIIATLVLLVFGNQLFYHLTQILPLLTHILLPVISFRSAIGFLIMLFFFTGLYMLVPNHKYHAKQPVTVFSQLPGGVTSTAGWMGFSYLYSFYVDHISNYSSFYGTMTMIALMMVWLYACMYILFFGGWLNHMLLRFTEKQAA